MSPWNSSDKSIDDSAGSDVVIIGMSCRFPGATDYERYWRNLVDGVNSIREIPATRWDHSRYYSPNGGEAKSHSKWCGLVDDIDQFDAQFFNISNREACDMDPQQRLLLEQTLHCIEDAGIARQHLQQHRTGVFVGFATGDYQQISATDDVKKDTYAVSGNFKSGLSNRISYSFNLRGPSISIDAACASGLVAVHEGVKALQAGECEYAIVGGVNANVHPWKYVIFSQANMLSRDGLCRPFDIKANGYVPGDGAGVLLLQRKSDAQRHRNRIVGIIRGSGFNHNGRSASISAPSLDAQRELIRTVYQRSRISPRTVTYVEAHGTGTSLGDPIEVEGLNQAFSEFTPDKGFCHIGSVKSNIGHLEGAAGVAGLIKVLLMMRSHWIPKTLHIETVNPIIDFARTPFVPAQVPSEWRRVGPDTPLRAGISSFGFTGANSHVIVEQAEEGETEPESAGVGSIPSLFMLSARSSRSLNQLIEKWQAFASSDDFSRLSQPDLCGTMLNSRGSYEYRYGFTLNGLADVLPKLEQFKPEPRVKQTNWMLRIGEYRISGYDEIRDAVEGCTVLKGELDEVLKEADAGLFYAPQWREPYRTVNQTLFGFAYVRALMKLGFQPATVDTEGAGLYLGWLVCGMVSVGSMVRALLSEDLSSLRLDWPAIPFRDRVHGREIPCFDVNEEYLMALLSSAAVEPAEVDYYVRQTRLLWENQFSFKRNLEEWIEVAKQFGLDLHSPLSTDGSLPAQMCFVLAAANSLDRVKTKWQLTGSASLANPFTKELLELINDEVLRKDEVISLIVNSYEKPLRQVIDSMCSRINAAQAKKKYVILAERNRQTSPVEDLNEWIGEYEQLAYRAPTIEETNVLSIGTAPANSGGRTVVAHLPSSTTHLQDEVLLSLWLAGSDIRWTSLIENQNYSKVPLPLYEFDRQRYWVGPDTRVERTVVRDELFFASKLWQASPPSAEARGRINGVVVVFANPFNLSKAHDLIRALPDVIPVVLELRGAENVESFRELTARLGPISALIDLSDLDIPENELPALLPFGKIEFLQSLVQQQEVTHVFHFTQGLQTFQCLRASLAGARFAGLIRLLGAEYRKLISLTIDIDDSWNSAAGIREILQNEWTESSYHPELLYRKSGRYLAVLADVPSRASEQSDLWVDSLNGAKTVLITGGTRGLGLDVAKLCIERGVRKLALIGVESIPPASQWQMTLDSESVSAGLKEKLRNLQDLKSRGAELLIFDGGLSAAGLAEAYARIRREFGPIHGVIHSAGVLERSRPSFVSKRLDDFKNVSQSKIEGLENLHRTLKDEPLEFFILFSSVAAAVTQLGAGFSDYALANSFMDYFAQYHAHLGRRYFRSIQWLAFDGYGMRNVKGPLYDELGFLLTRPDQGKELLSRFHSGMPANVLTGVRATGTRLGDVGTIQKNLMRTAIPKNAKDSGVSGADYRERLTQILANELRVQADSVDPDTVFADLGLDSIILAAFIRGIEKEIGLIVEPWVLLEANSISKLNKRLLQTSPQPAAVLEPAFQARQDQPKTSSPTYSTHAMAVIGIGCHFPGAESKDQFQSALKAGKAADPVSTSLRSRSLKNGNLFRLLQQIEAFDERYFEISKETASHLDPAARQILETATEAIQDAGYTRESIWGKRVGVFIAGRASGYQQQIGSMHKSSVTGIGQNFIAAHVSHFFNLKGPCLVVDAGTRSSLSSLALATRSISGNDCDVALVGGVDILFAPPQTDPTSAVWGEGAGCVLIKSLAQAIRDGDEIYAVLDESAVDYGQKNASTDENIRRFLRAVSAHPAWNLLKVVETVGAPAVETITRLVHETVSEGTRTTLSVGNLESITGRLSHSAGVAGLIKLSLGLHDRESEEPYSALLIDVGSDSSSAVVLLRSFEAKLFPEHRPRQSSVPAIQFRRNIHWPGRIAATATTMLALEQNGSHHQFRIDAANLILRDHLVYQKGVLPGVTYLDLVYRALAAEGWNPATTELRSVLFAEPLSLARDEERMIEVVIGPRNDSIIRVQSRRAASTVPEVHMTCEASSHQFASLTESLAFDNRLQGLSSIDLDAAYAILRRTGIQHGEFMKGSGRIVDRGSEMVARIQLSECARSYGDSFYLHPALLDASTIVPFVYGEELAGRPTQKPYIPLYIEVFRAFQGIGDIAHVRLQKQSMTHPSEDLFYSDIGMFDATGRLCATMTKLCVKQVRSERFLTRESPIDGAKSQKLKYMQSRG